MNLYLLVIILLFGLSNCDVQNKGGLDGANAGNFDNWVLATSWQSEWMIGDCENPHKQTLVDNFSPNSYGTNHMSLHGLWPNYNSSLRGGYEWPQYCSDNGIDFQNCEKSSNESYCNPSPITLSVYNVSKRWMAYAVEYSWSDLASHEWSKHGSCTGWPQYNFFSMAEEMYGFLSLGCGSSFLHDNVGKSVTYDDLYKSFSVDTNGKRPCFKCEDCKFSEVWTAWDADEETLAPTYPIDMSENDEDTCQICDLVEILDFQGCQ
jgi:ribonuclease I